MKWNLCSPLSGWETCRKGPWHLLCTARHSHPPAVGRELLPSPHCGNHFSVPTVICWEARWFSEYNITLPCIMYYLWEKYTVRVKKQCFLFWATHCFYHTHNVLFPLLVRPRTDFSDMSTTAAHLLLGSVWTAAIVHTATTLRPTASLLCSIFNWALCSAQNLSRDFWILMLLWFQIHSKLTFCNWKWIFPLDAERNACYILGA